MPTTARQIMVPADARFCDYKVVKTIDARRGQTVIIARLTASLKRVIPELRDTDVRLGLAVSECRYHPPHG
jgi:hypothetical protein